MPGPRVILVKRLPPPEGASWSVLVSYIITPFKTRATAEALIQEMASFQAASGEGAGRGLDR